MIDSLARVDADIALDGALVGQHGENLVGDRLIAAKAINAGKADNAGRQHNPDIGHYPLYRTHGAPPTVRA